ncbi:MAG: alpha/beta fold hydrolase [Synechococcales cyanobacterium C42_A2020_086]|jgi:fermentation-respiration switch protein FrsA (DUF1100 family)|nr:alpha/beta fold hydrolase [Synechococcales cyanobacterium M58_A2018_015]MBF2076732.1 alpha/beta fold hydrolase [Synechococcales cyanobacterium C42_A2020_086]
MLKLLLFTVGLLSILYSTACGALYLKQTRMIFLPTAQIEQTPAALNLSYQEVWLPVGNGDQIHGWWIPASGPERGVVLYLHGNGINIGANVWQAGRFHHLGLSVLLIDYRGYGRSQGAFPSEAQVYEDAAIAWDYLTQTRNIPPERIFIYGHSLGGAIAIELATHHPQAAGLIVQSSFTSMRQMVDRALSYARIFPVDWLLTQRFDSIAKVPALQVPVLFIHGKADSQIPFQMSKQLYAATPGVKQLYLVPLADHNDVADTAGAEYLQVLDQFVDQALQASQIPLEPVEGS